MQLRGFDGVCRLAEVGVGVGLGIVPATSAGRAARTMGIATVALSDPWAQRDLRICLRARAALTLAAQNLLAMLTA